MLQHQQPMSHLSMLQQHSALQPQQHGNIAMLQHPISNVSILQQPNASLLQQQGNLTMLQQSTPNAYMLQQPNASMLQQPMPNASMLQHPISNVSILQQHNALLQQQNAEVFGGAGSGSGIKIMARPQNASTVQFMTHQSQQRPPQTTYTNSTFVTYKSSENSACGRKRARREAIHIFERILQLTIQVGKNNSLFRMMFFLK